MAKKRVHELAKQYDMPSAEVMKRLNAYGLNVKASASAVDEDEAERALTGKAPKQETNGQPEPQRSQPRAAQQTGMGFDRPATDSARQRLEERQKAQQAARAKAKQDQEPESPPEDGARKDGDGQGGERRQRPTRSSLQG
jgi:translation initiation factor IF-2